MYSVYFVVSEHSLSDRIRSVIDFPRFDLQYFGTEYHSALALRLAIVAKPQIIVLDSDAPFISVSKFVSMLRENDVNCVLILLEGSDARHEPCPGIAAIRLDRNDLSPQRVQDAFRHAIAMADSRSAIRLTVSSRTRCRTICWPICKAAARSRPRASRCCSPGRSGSTII